ncbi:MAG: zinc ribbon domain-containing protein [Deltaproteobacteria bacterium]|jgi:hypothetical protein|nr:zinc ribbon domain-containing protein [Deltaproteobacteria bacterium]
MPTYTYQHIDGDAICEKGHTFEWDQVAKDWPLSVCPFCGKPVQRVLGTPLIKTKNFNCELRDKGFTKLVRVDEGIFENVTRRDGEAKYFDRTRPETYPKLEKTIKD